MYDTGISTIAIASNNLQNAWNYLHHSGRNCLYNATIQLYSHIRLVSMMQFSCKATIYLQHQLFKVAELVYIISHPKTPSV